MSNRPVSDNPWSFTYSEAEVSPISLPSYRILPTFNSAGSSGVGRSGIDSEMPETASFRSGFTTPIPLPEIRKERSAPVSRSSGTVAVKPCATAFMFPISSEASSIRPPSAVCENRNFQLTGSKDSTRTAPLSNENGLSGLEPSSRRCSSRFSMPYRTLNFC